MLTSANDGQRILKVCGVSLLLISQWFAGALSAETVLFGARTCSDESFVDVTPTTSLEPSETGCQANQVAFDRDEPVIQFTVMLSDAPAHSILRYVWKYPTGDEQSTVDSTGELGAGVFHVFVTRPPSPGGWPVGDYEILVEVEAADPYTHRFRVGETSSGGAHKATTGGVVMISSQPPDEDRGRVHWKGISFELPGNGWTRNPGDDQHIIFSLPTGEHHGKTFGVSVTDVPPPARDASREALVAKIWAMQKRRLGFRDEFRPPSQDPLTTTGVRTA